MTQWRNAKYTSTGLIDCEILLNEVWVPTTVDPNDKEAVYDANALYNEIDESGDAIAYVAPPEPTPEELLEQERAEMRSSPAQMRLALHRLGILTQVQAIADSDPEASIVWEYATTIERTSPLIDALGGPNGFTPEQIDDIFRTAMEISV